MENFDKFIQYLPFLAPIILLQFGLMIYAILDLSKRQKTKGPKWAWALAIVFIQLFGPIAYLLVGRGDEE
ncbi:MAG: PLDc_N domain-containing protein [Anaerolineaceae bacterium]|nr:PLDc_N domain-containing protein [Anaerolineaceae bacterium]